MAEEDTRNTASSPSSSTGRTLSTRSRARNVLCDPPDTTSSGTSSCWEEAFADNVKHLWCPSQIDILDQPPTALEFSRDYVRTSRPCIIRNAILAPQHDTDSDDHPNAARQPLYLTLDDIVERLDPETTRLTVDVTPDGHGDCVRRVIQHELNGDEKEEKLTTAASSDMLMFVQPKQVSMFLGEFRDRLRRQQANHKKKHHHHQHHRPSATAFFCDVNGLPSIQMMGSSSDKSTSKNVEEEEDQGTNVEGSPPEDSIVYYSRQNDCLRTREEDVLPASLSSSASTPTSSSITDLASLFVPSSLDDWAQQAFGTDLDAVNLWMGNEQSVSSMHKDHYENLFYVASGEKIFTVCPPADVPFLYQHVEYPSGQFEWTKKKKKDNIASTTGPSSESSSSSWRVRPFPAATTSPTSTSIDEEGSSAVLVEAPPETNMVRWIYPDVSKRDLLLPLRQPQDEFPLLRHTHPMEIRVQAGELLYLPSLWFHRVTQSCETIGVNYWYDMKFEGGMWCYFHLLEELRVVPTTCCSGRLLQQQQQQQEEEESSS